jgi:predicted nucleic acid-binding protein
MKIVVDSNIVFSALLKTQTTFGKIIFNSHGIFNFYTSRFLHAEIKTHWQKLKKISKLNDNQLDEAYHALIQQITFINEEVFPTKILAEAETLASDIDLDDTIFIALTKFIKGKLWTGDKALHQGLVRKGFHSVLTTSEIQKIWTQKKAEQASSK